MFTVNCFRMPDVPFDGISGNADGLEDASSLCSAARSKVAELRVTMWRR